MSDNNDKYQHEHEAPTPQQYFSQLHQTLQQKNQIIQHLQSRIKNQQKQIDMLITDAQEKHMHEITKYYAKHYQKYMKYGKYLLIKIEEQGQLEGIYLPKYAKIVHFGELQVLNNNYRSNNEAINGINKQRANNNSIANSITFNPIQPQPQQQQQPIQAQAQNINKNNENQQNQQKQLKQLPINKQQSTVQSYIKGLTQQIAQLKQKVKIFANQKSASKLNNNNNNNNNNNTNMKDNNNNMNNKPKDNENINTNPNNKTSRLKHTESKEYTNSPQISKFNQNIIQNQQGHQHGHDQTSVQSKIYDPNNNYNHHQDIIIMNRDKQRQVADLDDLRSPIKKKNKTKVIRFRK